MPTSTIVVPFSEGAASPSAIAMACFERGFDALFVVDPQDPKAAPYAPVLEQFGRVAKARDLQEVTAQLDGLRPAAVVTFTDSTLPLAIEVAEFYGLPDCVSGQSAQLVNKFVQRGVLNRHGVGSVRTVQVTGQQELGPADGVPIPGVLKPCEGAGSSNTVFVDSLDQLRDELAHHDPNTGFVVEEKLTGQAPHPRVADYVSVESVVQGGRVTHVGITGRLPLADPARERGLFFPFELASEVEDGVKDLAARAILALGIEHSVVHTEIKLSPNDPQVIEVNARLGGGVQEMLLAAGNFDMVGAAVDVALGRDVALPDGLTGSAMHLYVQPPRTAAQVLALPEREELMGVPGVYRVDPWARPGDGLDWRRGSGGRVFDVWIATNKSDNTANTNNTDNIQTLLDSADAVERIVQEKSEWRHG